MTKHLDMQGGSKAAHGTLKCSTCKVTVKSCNCVPKLLDCKKVFTTICPTCARNNVQAKVHAGDKTALDSDKDLTPEQVAPIQPKTLQLNPIMMFDGKGTIMVLQLKYQPIGCTYCKKELNFAMTETYITRATLKSMNEEFDKYEAKIKEEIKQKDD